MTVLLRHRSFAEETFCLPQTEPLANGIRGFKFGGPKRSEI